MKNTWIENDFGVLAANIAALQSVLNEPTKIVFVVKANAYGHGLVPVSQQAWECGVRFTIPTSSNTT